MKSLRSVFLFLVLAAGGSFASAGILVIKPDQNTVATAGKTLTVQWHKVGDLPELVSITLMRTDIPAGYPLLPSTANDGLETVTLPSPLVAGWYTIAVGPVDGSQPAHSARFRVAIAPPPMPDLIVCVHWGGRRPLMNEHILITVRVVNKGDAASTPCRLDWYAENLGTRPFDVPALAPNASHTVQHEFWWTSVGHKTISVNVDPANVVGELKETNNHIKGQVSVILPHQDRYVKETNICSDK
jgi:hypothetical protein